MIGFLIIAFPLELSRTVQLSRSKGSRKHVDPESLNHDDQIVDMDRQKFAIAKNVQEMDQAVAALQAEVQELRMYSLELDSNYSSTGATEASAEGTNGSYDVDGIDADVMDSLASSASGATIASASATTAAEGSVQRRRVSRSEMSAMDEEMLNEEEEILNDRAHAMAV